MNMIELLPKDLHALKINSIKKQLANIPTVKIKDVRRNNKLSRYAYFDGHYHLVDSKRGAELARLADERRRLTEELQILKSAWYAVYREPVPEMIQPHPVKRVFVGYGGQLVKLDRKFYEDLQPESNPMFLEYKKYFYNGVYYRSKAEREIAKIYTNLGIEFKYEPAVLLNASNTETYTDFVGWDSITESCFFHEHMGMKSLADYAHKAVLAMSDYTSAGILPGVDIIYTFEDADYNFDPELTIMQLSLLIQNRLRNTYYPTVGK